MVSEMMTRYTTDLLGTRLVVPTHLYQRGPGKGWDTKQQQDYVSSVFEGRAATPFVVNVVACTARVMDGGHRLEALDGFKRGKFGLRSGGQDYYWGQVLSRPAPPSHAASTAAPCHARPWALAPSRESTVCAQRRR